MFTTPAAASSIHLGQTLTLNWTASNASSCTASGSMSAAGAFSGSQTTSGPVKVVPTAPGSYTYTLTCSGAGGMASATTAMVTVTQSVLSALAAGQVLKIGSTVDPTNMDANPYGLAVAPVTAGRITQGDLIVCNFNDAAAIQGNGTTIVGLHAAAGSQPYHIAQSAQLKGCDAVTLLSDDSISAAGWSSAKNALVSPAGVAGTPFSGSAISQPWGEAYVPATAMQPAALYISNAPASATTLQGNGNIDRISLNGDAPTSVVEIATGFCTIGAPGAIYAPSGLTYDASIDTLYVIDTASNSVVAIANVSSVGADGVVVNGQCGAASAPPTAALTFSGPSAASARVIAHGAPLSAPLSAALLADGDLIVGNADIGVSATGPTVNLMIEVSPALPGGFVGQPFQADNGTPGALFGIATAADAQGNQIVYFNDDNANAVMQMGSASGGAKPPGYALP
jgi:PKD repeat protein